jgi:Family of unknown function (DUF6510)
MNGDTRREDPVGEAVRLDGNVAAGLLSEVFVPDMTTTRAMCANCGTIRPLGALPVYGQTMGRGDAMSHVRRGRVASCAHAEATAGRSDRSKALTDGGRNVALGHASRCAMKGSK